MSLLAATHPLPILRKTSTTSARSLCRCGQSWSDPTVPHYCQLIEPDLDIPYQPTKPPQHQQPIASEIRRPNKSHSTTHSVDSLYEVAKLNMTSTSTSITSTSTTSTQSSRASRHGESENIQVFIRIRPLIDRETSQPLTASTHSIRTLDDRTIEVRTTENTIKCSYDAVFDHTFTQEQVYDRVRECTESFLQGFNSTLFAYGQTGSGKSFTMFGNEADISRYRPGLQKSQAGIIPRAIKDIFAGVVQLEADAQAMVYCSFVQIYNEQIFDLLRDETMEHPLDIHEDRKNGIFVDGLSEYAVKTVNDCLSLLQCGEQHRAIRSTHMNQVSSRSHSVFQLQLEQRRSDGTTVKSKFNLVDLAGSEKWNFGSDMQHHHISEMTNINLSLHTLGRCIAALTSTSNTTTSSHVPYRDSKLTRLLQDSLGGNTKTKIIATLSPSLDCIEESISTLKFADRAKQVMVTVRVNEHREIDPAYVEKLEDEIQRLKEVVQLLQNGDKNCTIEGISEPQEDADNCAEGAEMGDSKLKARMARLIQENMDLKERNDKQLKDMNDLRARVLANGGGDSSSDAALIQSKQQLESTVRQLKEASDKFFRFEIEEDELKSTHERIFKSMGLPSPALSAGKPRPPNSVKPSSMLMSPNSSGSRGSIVPATADILYRVRGRISSLPGKGSGNTNNHLIAASKQEWRTDTPKGPIDSERELELSRKAIEKQQKLQNWLIEKEKRELLKLQQEQEYMDEQRRSQAERDAKFFKHAQATKKKLQLLVTKSRTDEVEKNPSREC